MFVCFIVSLLFVWFIVLATPYDCMMIVAVNDVGSCDVYANLLVYPREL